MDNNYPYNNQYPYPYHHPHGYPPGPPPPPPSNQDQYHGYPPGPPPPPPSNQDQYPPPLAQQYPYYPYPQPSYPPATSYSSTLDYQSYSPSHSGPISYQYPPTTAPPHTIQHHHSFQYGSASPHYQSYPPLEVAQQKPEQYPPQQPLGAHSFSSNHSQDGAGPSVSYPPLDDLLSKVQLSDDRPSVPASPPAPSAPSLPASAITPGHGSLSWGHDRPGDLYGYPNDSGNWEGTFLGQVDSSNDYAIGPSQSSVESQHSQSTQIVPYQKGSLKVLLLHGNLDIWVCDSKNLPNMDMFHKTLGDIVGRLPGNLTKQTVTSDPYVTVAVGGAVVARTFVISNSENPVWMQHFHVPVAHHSAEVHFVVKDSDVVGSQVIGFVPISVEQILSGEKIEGTYTILNNSRKPCKPGAVLRLSIQYIPMAKLSIYNHGVGAGPQHVGVPGTYFPLRKGGRVTLYQDADVPDGCLPNLKLDSGMSYVHGKCWEDMFDSICQARKLVYITGWSVWDKVRLVRDGGPASDFSLGELLKSKSQEGVRVLLLVWDDPTSRNILGYKTEGVMATHDEETHRFFKHSSVQVLLCPRIAGKRHSWAKQREVETIYTHHQKTVIVDADAGNNRRKIIAFVGGLDLCDGRYDTPKHPIFRTLQTVHKDDYHNPTFTGKDIAGCPREPWHDLHSRIDGPAAYDVLTNFEERWLKASKPHGIKKLKVSFDDSLLRIERIPEILGMNDLPWADENDPEAWHVQIFRSIDSNSVENFPKNPRDGTSKNLVCGKNVLIDMSIHTAYVKAIRAAQHFIYIENQYFIGSSFSWSSHKDLGANNLIPMEIALKIASKIKAHERFSAYIVIPMWPEGVPTGSATQRILFWQNKTMQMMYETIYKALVEAGLEGTYNPQDYLNFFCLGNREAMDSYDTSGIGTPSAGAANTPQVLSRKSRRFMIYVHSKGMIVDDEYVILGSANINQRSMEGTRDTEIAMGAYQPFHIWATKLSNPQAQIYGYRMSLWAEHLGVLEDCFVKPESLECVRRVRSMAEMNWKQFATNEVTELRGHLLKYPVAVDEKGKVKPIPGCESFPDVGGNICGSFLAIQENLTI